MRPEYSPNNGESFTHGGKTFVAAKPTSKQRVACNIDITYACAFIQGGGCSLVNSAHPLRYLHCAEVIFVKPDEFLIMRLKGLV